MGPSRADMLGADPVTVAIRNLTAEAEGLPEFELPAYRGRHPGVLSYRPKNAAEYDKDMRRAYFLERAEEAGFDTRTSEDQIRALRSAYAQYGEDWPIYNATRWFSSFPGAVYAAGQMLANQVDPVATPYPNAYRDFAKNVNNAVVVAEPMGKNLNHMRDMSDMRDAMHALPVSAPLQLRDDIRQAYKREAEPMTGSEMLQEANAEELVGDTGVRLLGGTMDYVFDPTMFATGGVAGLRAAGGGARAAAKAAVGNAFPTTLKGALGDYLLGSHHETLPLAIEGALGAKEYFRPSDAVYY